MVYICSNNLYILRKWQKIFSFLNVNHLVQKWFTQSFKKEIENRKKSFYSLFWKLKNVDSFKSYKGLKLNVENAEIAGIGSANFESIVMPFWLWTSNP